MRIGAYYLAILAAATACSLRAQQGHLVRFDLQSDALVNASGEPVSRPVRVYLPPGYEGSGNRRYPMAILLHAFGADGEDWLGTPEGYEGLDFARALDSLISARAVGEFIVVMPDATTRLGGSWYSNSSATGDWEAFIAQELVASVEDRFRVIQSPTSRAIVGQSMGAYGALRIAMRYPGVFAAVVAVSPVPVEDPNPLGELGMRMALEADTMDLASAAIPAKVLWSRALAFSPRSDRPFGHLPYEMVEGKPVRVLEVWSSWEAATLTRMVEEHSQGLRSAKLRLEVGEDDALRSEIEDFSQQLQLLGIEHEFEVFPGGHVVGVRHRFEAEVFQYLTRVLEDGHRDQDAL